ncbi:MAG: hypothetical protein ABIQ02_10920 [Saprospiraceae bacterium]
MKALFFVLIISILTSLPVLGEEIALPGTELVSTTNHLESSSSESISNHQANPRRKVKKKRQTILNRKTKHGHGHHCPSF